MALDPSNGSSLEQLALKGLTGAGQGDLDGVSGELTAVIAVVRR